MSSRCPNSPQCGGSLNVHKNEWSTELYCDGCGFHEVIKFDKPRQIARRPFGRPVPRIKRVRE